MSRAYCYRCQRVKDACICQDIVSIHNSVSVYVLQHPDEARQSKGTEIIARLSLENYHCWQAEDFSSHKLLNRLIESCPQQIAVVYPCEDAVSVTGFLDNKQCTIKHLIFIDATWRKAKKIWSLSTNLHQLTSLQLDSEMKSNYRIRKVPGDGYLSTVEAIAYCLSEFDSNPDKYKPMLNIFNAVINAKIDDMGQDVYEKNYNKRDIKDSK